MVGQAGEVVMLRVDSPARGFELVQSQRSLPAQALHARLSESLSLAKDHAAQEIVRLVSKVFCIAYRFACLRSKH